MNEPDRKPIVVVIAFVLPLLFIAIIFLSTTLPAASLSTDYDFVYATCSEGNTPYNYNCSNYLNRLYRVVNGRLTEQAIPAELDSDNDGTADVLENYRTRLFLHDTGLDQSREITLQEAQSLPLHELLTSPDGVAVEWAFDRGYGFFPFYSGSYENGYYLTRGDTRKPLNLIGAGENNYYRDDFSFIGWVVP
ncbi:MAG: hypothetical protein RLZZ385_1404 [Pseudomonadota bacterium]